MLQAAVKSCSRPCCVFWIKDQLRLGPGAANRGHRSDGEAAEIQKHESRKKDPETTQLHGLRGAHVGEICEGIAILEILQSRR